MNVPIPWGLLTSISVMLLFVGLLSTRLFAYTKRRWDPEPDQAEGFSLGRYEPMVRLLSEDDLVFLAAQPGYRPEIGAKLRRERRRIFRLYLQDLAQDFHRLHAEARTMVADAQKEHAELVGVLIRQQVAFWRAMLAIEMRLLTDVGLGKLDVRGLVESIEAMRLELARFNLTKVEAPAS
jgi:hypothetical protein